MPRQLQPEFTNPTGDYYGGVRLPEFRYSITNQAGEHPIHVVGRYLICETHSNPLVKDLRIKPNPDMLCVQRSKNWHDTFSGQSKGFIQDESMTIAPLGEIPLRSLLSWAAEEDVDNPKKLAWQEAAISVFATMVDIAATQMGTPRLDAVARFILRDPELLRQPPAQAPDELLDAADNTNLLNAISRYRCKELSLSMAKPLDEATPALQI